MEPLGLVDKMELYLEVVEHLGQVVKVVHLGQVVLGQMEHQVRLDKMERYSVLPEHLGQVVKVVHQEHLG
jgi:hypothetical protein